MIRCAVVLAVAIAGVLLAPVPASAEPFSPGFGTTRLVRGDRRIEPLETEKSPPPGIRAGRRLLQVEDTKLRALSRSTGEVLWIHTFEDLQRPVVLAVGDEVVYVELRAPGENDDRVPAGRGMVQRLSLADGKARPPLRVPDGKPGDRVRAVLEAEEAVFVLTVADRSGDVGDEKLGGYRVVAFRGDEAAWVREFESAGEIRGPTAILLGGGGPAWAGPGTRPLTVIRDDVVVCAGGGEDLIALDRSTGKNRWRLPAIWEFERGFIGPSVWAYHLTRGGVEPGFGEAELDVEVAKRREDLRRLRRIVAGPLAVPWQDAGDEFGKEPRPGYRLFVTVAHDVNEDAGGYLSHAWVYEVDDDGIPVAVLPMPRMVRGGFVRGNEAVWLCEGGGIGATAPSFQKESPGIGGGGTDHVGRLAWYREPSGFSASAAWMTTGRTGDHRVLDENRMFLVPAGAYVLSKEERVFRLPVLRLDLATGRETSLILEIPFEGDVPPPTENFAHSTPSDGRETWTVFGPHLLAIVGLEVEPGRLAIDVGRAEGDFVRLVFPDRE